MKKILYIFLLGFIPLITFGESNQEIFSADSLFIKKNKYLGNFRYSKEDKPDESGYHYSGYNGHIAMGLSPNEGGLGAAIVFSSMTYKDKKILYDTYPAPEDRVIHAPRKNVSILLSHQHFVTLSVTRNIRLVDLGFPYIASKMKFIETIASRNNDLSITLDKRIKFSTGKDARKDRIAWLDQDIFIKKGQRYSDQIQLKVEQIDIAQLKIKTGCLSSRGEGRINHAKVFMTEIGKNAKLKNIKIIDLTFSDPVFHTSFYSKINLIKIQGIPKFKQHEFKLVCTTTKGKQLNTQHTFISTMKPRFNNEEPYR